MQSDDRVLHMSDVVASRILVIRDWASKHGALETLNEGLDYLRRYSGGPESDWKTMLFLDTPRNEDCKNFIASIYRRRRDSSGETLAHYMTIGMIFDDRTNTWSFHS